MTALGAPTTTTLAEPATTLAPAPVVASVDPALEAQRGAAADRENRDAERTRIAQSVATAATQRASNLDTQGDVIDKTSDGIKKARAKAKAEAAAKAKAAAKAAEAKRKAAIKAQGYEAGTTDPREMARQILDNKFGYGSDQFSCFDWIIKHESNWNVHATNPGSGAYGLPQSLPGSKMASVASDWRDNPATQIIWGAKYMKDRYGSPCAAKSHWQSAGNY
ncbi:Transglycosylase SLT domain-containing protein [Microlunatus sagamiharensis]|uniref:Transglycosylase SLT domain-containing protein n=1 Tax=Microlunatus sagamiharensis TaxID=546874 RepID=A0A1H2MU55_9ACTN|nr:transglycosylase SLT domain-containing protein [Microlunatus sagamiharensis]SDU96757.1 Transglycosylase SLT domain-containing protein [Microlunatus sagamiharensis]